MKKRAVDLVLAVPALIVLSPVILAAAAVATIDTSRFGIFSQTRIGRHAQPFNIYKIRTMRGTGGTTITTTNDSRITTAGRWMRRFKLDELPQLWNVINGTMSLVGPRPDVVGYADCLKGQEREILGLRPGITGPASLVFRDEQSWLGGVADPSITNDTVLWPLKVRINLAYGRRATIADDLKLIGLTLRRDPHRLSAIISKWDQDLLWLLRRLDAVQL